MGVTGASGFPCCGKESVDIVETHGGLNQQQLLQGEEEIEQEKELLEPEPTHKEDPDLTSEVELEGEPELKDPEPLESRTESLQPHTPQNTSLWSMRSHSSSLSLPEEDQASTHRRSIRVQTSKHLFWADKVIQASEHSLRQATTSHQDQQSGPDEAICCTKPVPDPGAEPAPSAADSQQPANPQPSSGVSPGIGLAELVNFASSLAVASSSKMDLPTLEHMIKAPPQKAEAPSTDPAPQPARDQPEKEKPTKDLPEKSLEAGESQKAWKQEDKNFFHPYLDFSKPGTKRATIEGEVQLLQQPARSPPPTGAVKGQPKAEDQEIPNAGTGNVQQPRRLPTQDPGEQGCRTRKGRPQQPAAPLSPREPASVVKAVKALGVKAMGAKQCSRRPREFKCLAATSSVRSGSGSQSSSADENLLPLTARLLAAFQEVFKLFSSDPTGSVDMRSMKAALRNVGIQLSPQEMCEALQQADLDGDGTVSFKDFLGVLTDSYRLALCLGQVRNSQFCDPQGLQTLFLETLFKLMSQGFVPHKVVQEVMSYYTKKQRALQLNPGWKGRSRGHSGTRRPHAGLTFFCQAARLSGLSSAELERSLHRLHKAGARSPYSQIPNLAGRTPPEDRMRHRAPRPNIRLPKSCHSSRHKLVPTQRCLSPELVGQPPDYLRPSPPTLVQKQPFSPSPACLQKLAKKK